MNRTAGLRGLLPPKDSGLPPLHTLATTKQAPPPSFDATLGYTGWGMLGNGPDPTLTINGGRPVGNCFFAAVCHILELKALKLVNGKPVIPAELWQTIQPTANRWVGLYLGFQRQQTPGTVATSGPDKGTEPTAGFRWLQAGGIIKRWGPVAPSQLNAGTYDHQGLLLACALDQDAEQEFEKHQPWLNLPTSIDPIAGGHAIARARYTPTLATEITWGADEPAELAWENNHVQQAYWLQAPWETDAAGYDFTQLDAATAAS